LSDFTEKRQHPRYDVVWPVMIYLKDKIIEGETINVSAEGIAIQCDEPLPLNEVFNIALTPHDNQQVAISGKVVWSDVYGIGSANVTYGMGICMIEISDNDRNRFEELISVFT
jgi:Tfp pilus assembly protein PilZ